jgi:hypothetical protein
MLWLSVALCWWLSPRPLCDEPSDPTTLEWTDGVFTGQLRAILTNMHGESKRRHWIVFDGDVDPEWAENLNSVLDDNRLLTLPSGERLEIPDNVRLLFEVHSLRHATLATVSRCGMVWFSDDVVSVDMVCREQLLRLRRGALGASSLVRDLPPSHHHRGSSVSASADGFDAAGSEPVDSGTSADDSVSVAVPACCIIAHRTLLCGLLLAVA